MQSLGEITKAEANALFGQFSIQFSQDHQDLIASQVREALQSICNACFRYASDQARSFRYEHEFGGKSVGKAGCTLFRPYEEIVTKVLATRWQLELTRSSSEKLFLQKGSESPMPKKLLDKVKQPYCYNYTLRWQTDNVHVNPPVQMTPPQSDMDLLRVLNKIRLNGEIPTHRISILFTDMYGQTYTHEAQLSNITLVPTLVCRSLSETSDSPAHEEISQIRYSSPCTQQQFAWALNFIHSNELFPPESAPQTPLTVRDYLVLCSLAVNLKHAPLVLFCCHKLAEVMTPDTYLPVAAAIVGQLSYTPRYQSLDDAPLPPCASIPKYLETLIQECRRQIYCEPESWSSIPYSIQTHEELLHLYQLAIMIRHVELQHGCNQEFRKRIISTPETSYHIFKMLTQFLGREHEDHIAQLHTLAAEQIHIPCDWLLQSYLRPIMDKDIPPLDLERKLDLFRITTISGFTALNGWLKKELLEAFKANPSDTWVPILTVATEPMVGETDDGKAVWEAIREHLLANEDMMDFDIPLDANASVLARIAYVGEVLERTDFIVKPALLSLKLALLPHPEPSHISAIFEISQRTHSEVLNDLLCDMLGNEEAQEHLKCAYPQLFERVSSSLRPRSKEDYTLEKVV